MKRLIFFLFFLVVSQELIAQTYSYSYSGLLPVENTDKFKKEISELPAVLTVEIKQKHDSQKGEILFSIDPMNERGENDHPFSPVDLKSIILSFGLTPIEFRQLK